MTFGNTLLGQSHFLQPWLAVRVETWRGATWTSAREDIREFACFVSVHILYVGTKGNDIATSTCSWLNLQGRQKLAVSQAKDLTGLARDRSRTQDCPLWTNRAECVSQPILGQMLPAEPCRLEPIEYPMFLACTRMLGRHCECTWQLRASCRFSRRAT